jgi:hypothetical protein
MYPPVTQMETRMLEYARALQLGDEIWAPRSAASAGKHGHAPKASMSTTYLKLARLRWGGAYGGSR